MEEEEILELNLASLFDEHEVVERIEKWADAIRQGKHQVFSVDGYYGTERLS